MSDASEFTFKDLIATSASITTIIQFLTGTLVCLKIVQNKSTGDASPFPYVSGCLSTSLWLRYGFFIQERSIILVNTIGASLFLGYVVTFLIYSIKKSTVIRQFIICTLFLIVTLLYVQHTEDIVKAKKFLGIVCSVMTILFFAAPLASFFHVIKVKNTESLPFPIILGSFLVSVQWLIYGVILGDAFLKITNFVGSVLSVFQLGLFYVYPRTPRGYSSELI